MSGKTIFLIINVLLAIICFLQNTPFFYGVGVFLLVEGTVYYYLATKKKKVTMQNKQNK